MIRSTTFGFPKIGPDRELKKTVESFWKGALSEQAFFAAVEKIKSQRLKTVADSGVDIIPSNDFSLYDIMLDLSAMFGVIPKRFGWSGEVVSDATYFAMARGSKNAIACELTKWFDTNYHYIVPELTGTFTITKNRPLLSFQNAQKTLKKKTKPVLVGPFTYIALGKFFNKKSNAFEKGLDSAQFHALVLSLAKTYNQVLSECRDAGVTCVQLDEPALTLDLTPAQVQTLTAAYKVLTNGLKGLDIHVQTYYESVSCFDALLALPIQGIGLDFVSNSENLSNLKKSGFPKTKTLIAGLIDGRNIWKTKFADAIDTANAILKIVPKDRLIISNAAPLFHLPVSTTPEQKHLDGRLLQLISFASERLEELQLLKDILNGKKKAPKQDLESVRKQFANPAVQKLVSGLKVEKIGRKTPFKTRYQKQLETLDLPLFPTTTIGSFPQTPDLRAKRADFKAGRITRAEYDRYIRNYIIDVVKMQEKLNLDVLVHGEPERTDMVEFFGEQLSGFAFTKNGWVQSYGSRCVRPPLIYGDVSRPNPMTVKETAFAQSQTKRQMKGMLTGPVTILNWSFARKDISKQEIAFQIGLALRNEVLDLEKSGIRIIQIDEPAFREGLPLKKKKQAAYLKWAVAAFKLSHDTVADKTQIHTHMCYSEFNEIMAAIHAMDADVISIEASRSKGEILAAFEAFDYDLGIGLGVYDIHSPRVPSVQEMVDIAERSVRVLGKELVWINPDCGLKTRGFDETKAALKNMVEVAQKMRAKHNAKSLRLAFAAATR